MIATNDLYITWNSTSFIVVLDRWHYYLLFHTNNKNMWLSKNIDYFILEPNSAKRFVIGYFNNYLLFHTNKKNMWLSKNIHYFILEANSAKRFVTNKVVSTNLPAQFERQASSRPLIESLMDETQVSQQMSVILWIWKISKTY